MNRALYCNDPGDIPPAISGALLKRSDDNQGWELKTPTELGITRTLLQTQFKEVTVDTTTTSTSLVDLLSQSLTTTAGSSLLINVSASISNSSANRNIDIQLMIDGVAVRGAGTRVTGTGIPGSLAIVYKKVGLAAGNHTIKVRWRTDGSTARVRPIASVNEHASLMIQEVTV